MSDKTSDTPLTASRVYEDRAKGLGAQYREMVEHAECLERQLSAAKEEIDGLRKDAARLQWLEERAAKGGCSSLLYDDNGHWAVVEDRFQMLPESDEPQTLEFTFIVETDKWKPSVRAAIDAAMPTGEKAG